MSNSLCFIIIPVHNRINFTLRCIDSLTKQVFKNFKIVVIDDGSTDGTSEKLSELSPDVYIIKGDGNLWWTAATNLGVKYALENKADFILTLNNDTYADPYFLENMIKWTKEVPHSLLGAFALDANSKKPVYGGERINWLKADSLQLLDVLKDDELHGIKKVTHFPGRGLLIPRIVFEKIGLYDEKTFPHYAADYDFTHRAVRNGFQIFCNYDAKLYIYPDESGNFENRREKSFKKYLNHLFDIKGGGNLKVFTRYVLKNCPPRYIPFYFLRGTIQRVFGYWLKED